MKSAANFGFGTQIRKSPYFDATVRWGATGFSVYNHMYIPRDFGSPEQNFWNLVNDAILCDVAVERQVEITGPDAAQFVQTLTSRDLSKMAVGQCKYILISNAEGGILNDPILLRLAECLTSAPTGQIYGFEQRRISGSSKPIWSEDEQEIRNIEGRR